MTAGTSEYGAINIEFDDGASPPTTSLFVTISFDHAFPTDAEMVDLAERILASDYAAGIMTTGTPRVFSINRVDIVSTPLP
jgi:hypothetical protein